MYCTFNKDHASNACAAVRVDVVWVSLAPNGRYGCMLECARAVHGACINRAEAKAPSVHKFCAHTCARI